MHFKTCEMLFVFLIRLGYLIHVGLAMMPYHENISTLSDIFPIMFHSYPADLKCKFFIDRTCYLGFSISVSVYGGSCKFLMALVC